MPTMHIHAIDLRSVPAKLSGVSEYTDMLYPEASINGRYFALTKNVALCSCVCLYELKAI